MKRFLSILAATLLVALPALGDGWTVGTGTVTPEVTVDQTFTYAYTTTGFTTTHQDLTSCGNATITIPNGAAAQALDCPASDSDRTECRVVATLPDPRFTESTVNTAGAQFSQGFAMLRITDAVPSGNITFQCPAAEGTYSSADGWVARTTVPDHYDVAFETPATTDHVMVKVQGGPLTLSSLNCTMIGATTGNLVDAAGASCVTTGLTVTPIANATNYPDTTPTNALIDDGDWLQIDVTTVTTIPEWLYCTVDGTK
jgi:hypothetical protein